MPVNFPDLKPISAHRLYQMAKDPYFAFERKWDGTAVSVNVTREEISLVGRGILKDGSQSDYTDKFPEILDGICDVLDREFYGSLLGEIVISPSGIVAEAVESFQTLQTRTTRQEEIDEFAAKYPATLILFDLDAYAPYTVRKHELKRVISKPNSMVHILDGETSTDGKMSMIAQMEQYGWEGLVSKRTDCDFGIEQYKYKPTNTQDVFWEGEYIPGKKRHEGKVGSLICYQYINGKKEKIGSVGTMDDATRNLLTRSIEDGTISKDNPLCIEVKYFQRLHSYKLRYPSFVRIRGDKSPSQCIAKDIKEVKKEKKEDLNQWF